VTAELQQGSASPEPQASGTTDGQGLSLDTWAVLVAVVAALLIRIGCITRVPW
jgi:hypothetical protein